MHVRHARAARCVCVTSHDLVVEKSWLIMEGDLCARLASLRVRLHLGASPG